MTHTLYIQCEKDHYQKYYSDKQQNYETDCGFDLFCPKKLIITGNSFPSQNKENKIDLGVKCKLVNSEGKNVGFDLRPRSSMGSKTPLSLSNSIGTVDPEYRGSLIACVDNNTKYQYSLRRAHPLKTAYFFSTSIYQFICSPFLCPY